MLGAREEGCEQDTGSLHPSHSGNYTSAFQNTTNPRVEGGMSPESCLYLTLNYPEEWPTSLQERNGKPRDASSGSPGTSPPRRPLSHLFSLSH